MEKGLFHRNQNIDKLSHIFCQIEIFPVADVKTPPVFYALNRVDAAKRMDFRRHFNVINRTDEDGVAGDGGSFSHLNAAGLKKDFRLNVIGDKQPVLGDSDAVSRLAADKLFILGFGDVNRSSRGNPFGYSRVFAG